MNEIFVSIGNKLKNFEETFYQSTYQAIDTFKKQQEAYYLTTIINSEWKNERILIFPPLTPRGRFLIHKCAENFASLKSVSLGLCENRRVVIFCNHHQQNSYPLNLLKVDKSHHNNIMESSNQASPRFFYLHFMIFILFYEQ